MLIQSNLYTWTDIRRNVHDFLLFDPFNFVSNVLITFPFLFHFYSALSFAPFCPTLPYSGLCQSHPFMCLLIFFYRVLHPSLFGPRTEAFLAWTYLMCRMAFATAVRSLAPSEVTDHLTAFLQAWESFELIILTLLWTRDLLAIVRLVWFVHKSDSLIRAVCCHIFILRDCRSALGPDIPALMAVPLTAIISLSRLPVFWFLLSTEHFKALLPVPNHRANGCLIRDMGRTSDKLLWDSVKLIVFRFVFFIAWTYIIMLINLCALVILCWTSGN